MLPTEFSLEDIQLPAPLAKLTREHLETNDPILWKSCYPRIYENLPGGYPSPKVPAWELAGIAEKVRLGYRGQSEMIEIAWGSKLIEKKVPAYWLCRDLAEAVQQTVPPVEFSWQTEHLPFEAAVFMLPENLLVHGPKEGWATFVSYARLRTEVEVVNYAYPKTVIVPRPGNFVVMAHTQRGCLQHFNFPATSWPILKLAELDSQIQASPYTSHTSGVPGFQNFTMTDTDNNFMARVTHLVLGLLVLMTRRPDLVETGKQTKRIPAKAGSAPKEFWCPNVIGRNYRIRKLYVPQGGTHASPRGHWVRGFYREQHFGPKTENQVKIVWVEPYARAFGEDADSNVT